MDKKLDELTGHFQVGGIVGKMSGQVEKLTIMAENGSIGKSVFSMENVKWLALSIFALAMIIAALLKIDIPIGF